MFVFASFKHDYCFCKLMFLTIKKFKSWVNTWISDQRESVLFRYTLIAFNNWFCLRHFYREILQIDVRKLTVIVSKFLIYWGNWNPTSNTACIQCIKYSGTLIDFVTLFLQTLINDLPWQSWRTWVDNCYVVCLCYQWFGSERVERDL